MVVARSLTEVQEWEHSGTTFFIRQLPHRVMLRLESMEREEQLELLVRAGCSGWRDMEGATSTLADATIAGISVKKALSEASYDALPLTVVGDLSVQVLHANRLTDEDAGN